MKRFDEFGSVGIGEGVGGRAIGGRLPFECIALLLQGDSARTDWGAHRIGRDPCRHLKQLHSNYLIFAVMPGRFRAARPQATPMWRPCWMP